MAYDIQGNWYLDPAENQNYLSSGSMVTGQGVSTPLAQTGYQGFIHPWVKQNFPLAGNWDQPGMLETVNPGYKFDTEGYKAFGIPKSSSGVDNKQDYIKSLIDSGAVKIDGTPLTWDNMEYGEYVRVPDAKIGDVIKAIDYNPSEDKDWGPLIGALFLGGVGAAGGFGGMFGGEAAAGTAGEAATGSTLADLYGTLTNTSVAAAPGAATNSALYQAILGGAAGGAAVTPTLADLYGSATGQSVLSAPTAQTGSALYEAATTPQSMLPDVVGNTLINQTPYGSLLQTVPEGSVNAFGNPLGTAMSTTPELSQSMLSAAGIPAGSSGNVFDSLGNLLSGNTGKLVSGALSGLGGLFSGNAATDAAKTQADAIIQAARIAADAAKFRPVGITTRFGNSQFGYDANGNLVSAGYALKPDVKAQQDSLMGESNQLLQQYLGANEATAPMGTAAQSMFGLGQGYLNTSPQEQAAKYMAEQQALLAPTRERELAALQARLQAQGRMGLATGGTTTGLNAANPDMEAFYNAQRMQDLKLASEATQGGMDYAKFGAGMVGSGGDLLKSMYGTQSAAYNPYSTAIGGSSYLEGLGQNAMDMGINIGAKGTAASANSGQLLSQGMINAANVMAPSNAYSPWGALLSGAGNAVSQYANPQQQYKFDPFTGRAL